MRRLRRLLLLPLAFALVTAVDPAPATAAETFATFGTPSASGSFGHDLVFHQPVTVDRPIGRAELLVTFADAIGPAVFEVTPPSGTGSVVLDETLAIADIGNLLPNTPIKASWRLSPAGDLAATQTGPSTSLTYADERFDWRTKSGPVVRVHWYQGDDAFGARALDIGEKAIAKSAALLGVTETKPVDFFVYADQGAFYDALGPGTRENVGGQADAEIRTLFALITPSDINASWVETVIPHELTHLVVDAAAKNPYHFPPRWLNEGLAVYESEGYGSSDRGDVKAAARDASLMPLTALTGQFPTTEERFRLAYAESVSAVDYLIRTAGKDALVGLIRSYADGRTDDEAFQAATGKTMAGFSDAWLADVDAKPPTKTGPQPAPAGPVPPGWTSDGGGGAVASSAPAGGAGLSAAPAGPVPASGGDASVASASGAVVTGIVVGVLLIALAIFVIRRRRPAES